MKKTFNIWKLYNGRNVPPTGPWKWESACVARDESEALSIAIQRHGEGEYKLYEGF